MASLSDQIMNSLGLAAVGCPARKRPLLLSLPPALLVVAALLSLTAYAALGNLAAFFEIAAAARLDGTRKRICLLPFLIFGFAVSIFSVSRAAFSQVRDLVTGADFHWDKTERFRRAV